MRRVSIHAPAWGATTTRCLRGLTSFNPRPRVGGDRARWPRVSPDRFQSTPPRGGRRHGRTGASEPVDGFNPRPRVGGDLAVVQRTSSAVEFQSTPPRGGRRRPLGDSSAVRCFNPRPRVGGDRAICRHDRMTSMCFNPRPRVGGDDGCASIGTGLRRVSIHAPAWGATCRPSDVASTGYRFQSTPPRGGRHEHSAVSRQSIEFQSTPPRGGRHAGADGQRRTTPSFNPRPRVGGDDRSRQLAQRVDEFQSTPPRGGRRALPVAAIGRDVSIHAPAWGATVLGSCQAGSSQVSIHAPAWGATGTAPIWRRLSMTFQSTPPRGGRPVAATDAAVTLSEFQSTPPRGGRPAGAGSPSVRATVSIHAPAWGATGRRRQPSSIDDSFNPRPRVGGDVRAAERGRRACQVSIHAPAWGATRRRMLTGSDSAVSIHAPAWGATAACTARPSQIGFNPRPRVGGDRGRVPRWPSELAVSIHAPAWGATTRGGSARGQRSMFQSTPPRGGRRTARPGVGLPVIEVSIHAPAWGATR